MRRLLIAPLLAVLLLTWAGAVVAGPAPASLRAGDTMFWNGPYIEGPVSGMTYSYSLIVEERAHSLRFGIDHPEVEDDFSATVTDPSGDRSSLSANGGIYSGELVRLDPKPGKWTITVIAEDVTDSAFRVRAKLEAKPPPLGVAKGPVLPNLQVLPPHAATFFTPVTNGATGEDPTGIDLMGAEACHPEERAEEQALRCLRFAFGIRNTGLGPLQLSFNGSVPRDHELIQTIELAQGGSIDRSAGTARYHKTHAHYHHSEAVGLQLFEVTDRKTGALEPAGDEQTKGFAHRDELLREWDRFYPLWPDKGFGLAAGWADIYEWDRPGNYIDFGLNDDGFYLIRMVADPVKGVAESNEKDNTGYTYFKVTGDEVELLEVGRGSDPWDPCKIETGFGGHPDPRQPPRPARCPPDTT
jgi:hypothetical protein